MFELGHPTLDYPWQMVFSSSATDTMTVNTMIMEAVKRGERPKIDDTCSAQLSDLIQKCWSEGPDDRPSAKELVVTLTYLISTDSAQVMSCPFEIKLLNCVVIASSSEFTK